MSECIRLSDRMPAVILGHRDWSAEEIRHLGECASCRAEWQLVQAANRLGDQEGRRIDEENVSRTLLARLATERAAGARRRAWSAAGLAAAAAAISALIWTGSAVNHTERALVPSTVALQIPLPELDSLQPAELDSVLQTIDEAGVQGSTLDSADLGELENDELESVLDYWEG